MGTPRAFEIFLKFIYEVLPPDTQALSMNCFAEPSDQPYEVHLIVSPTLQRKN